MDFDNKIKLIHQKHYEERMGTIIKFSDDSLVAKFENNNELILNTKVHLVLFHMTMGEMSYEADVHDVYKNQVIFINLNYLNSIQRRSETRAKFCARLEIEKVFCNAQEVCLHKKIVVETVDLSANGIQLSCKADFPSDIVLYLNIPIDGEIITCDAVVNRKIEQDGLFFYGCSLAVSEPLRNKIRRHVFRLQLEERKKQKEKKKYNERAIVDINR